MDQPLPSEVLSALSDGSKPRAVTVLMQCQGLEPPEAHARIDRYLNLSAPAVIRLGRSGAAFELPPQVLLALQQDRKIEAVALLRDAAGLDLQEAQRLVDAHEVAPAPPAGRSSLGLLHKGSGRLWGAMAFLLLSWLLFRLVLAPD